MLRAAGAQLALQSQIACRALGARAGWAARGLATSDESLGTTGVRGGSPAMLQTLKGMPGHRLGERTRRWELGLLAATPPLAAAARHR